MDNYSKIEQARKQLHERLSGPFLEYVQAELDYNSEIDNGYSRRDLLAAELRLIAAMDNLLKKIK